MSSPLVGDYKHTNGLTGNLDSNSQESESDSEVYISSGRQRSERRSPIRRLYEFLSGSGLACKSVMSPLFPTNMASVFKIIKSYILFVLGQCTN